MSSHRTLLRLAPWVLLGAGLTLGAGTLFADVNGRTGRTTSANGCNCHGSSVNAGVTVSISGPQTVSTNSVSTYTVTVSGGPAGASGGFDLKASAGTLTAGTNDHVVGLEVTHNGNTSRSFTFTWTAPATAGTQNFWAVGVASNGDNSTSGDQWNFYGGAVNTAFPITVNSATGVEPTPTLAWLASPAPNPCTSVTRIAFSLARAGHARLDVLDATGRRVATLLDGDRPEGPQSATWDGRGASGSLMPAGTYFVRLDAAGAQFSRRLVVVR